MHRARSHSPCLLPRSRWHPATAKPSRNSHPPRPVKRSIRNTAQCYHWKYRNGIAASGKSAVPCPAVQRLRMLSPGVDGNFTKSPLGGRTHGGFHPRGTPDTKTCDASHLRHHRSSEHPKVLGKRWQSDLHRTTSSEVFNTAILANLLVKSWTLPWFCSPRCHLLLLQGGRGGWHKVLAIAPDTWKETLQSRIVSNVNGNESNW